MNKQLLQTRLRNLMCYALTFVIIAYAIPKVAYAYTDAQPLHTIKDFSFADAKTANPDGYAIFDTRYKYRIDKQDYIDFMGCPDSAYELVFFVDPEINILSEYYNAVVGMDSDNNQAGPGFEEDPDSTVVSRQINDIIRDDIKTLHGTDNGDSIIFDFSEYSDRASFLYVSIPDSFCDVPIVMNPGDGDDEKYYGVILVNGNTLNGQSGNLPNKMYTMYGVDRGFDAEIPDCTHDFSHDPINLKRENLTIGSVVEPYNAVSFTSPNLGYDTPENAHQYDDFTVTLPSDATAEEISLYGIDPEKDLLAYHDLIIDEKKSWNLPRIYKVLLRDSVTHQTVDSDCGYLFMRHFQYVGYSKCAATPHLILFDDTYDSYTLSEIVSYRYVTSEYYATLCYNVLVFDVPGSPVQCAHTTATREENRVEPTCTTAGSVDSVTYCTKCLQVLSTVTQTIAALNHDLTDWVIITQPTCTADGSQERHCTRCDYSETQSVARLGHNLTDWVIAAQPTCTADGSKTRHCTRCEYSETASIKKLPHVQGIRKENEVKPTCINAGSYDEVKYCTVGGEIISKKHVEVPAIGHDFTEWVVTKEPTNATKGTQERHCKRCDYKETADVPVSTKTAKVDGRIIGSDGKPIANKIIELHSDPQRTMTDSTGYFAFNSVPLGQHTLTIFDDKAATKTLCKLSLSVNATQSSSNTESKDSGYDVNVKVNGSDLTANITGIKTNNDSTQESYTITVIDKYGDEDVVRAKDVLAAGIKYTYSAIPKDGYVLDGTNVQSGVVTKDETIVFKYLAEDGGNADEPEADPGDDPYENEDEKSHEEVTVSEPEEPVNDTPKKESLTISSANDKGSTAPKTGDVAEYQFLIIPLLLAGIIFLHKKSKGNITQ